LQDGERWVAVSPPDGTAVLALVAPKRESMQYKLIGRSTQVVFVTEDVAAKFVEWSKRGVKFLHTPRLRRIKYHLDTQTQAARQAREASMLLGEQSNIWGGVFTRFRDVDGNIFSLVSFDEVTHGVEAQRRAIQEKQEAERRYAREMDIAKEVQWRLFPQKRPPMESLEYAGLCLQARQVGGVVGKGIAAALLMANLQANLRSQCAIALDQPQNMLRAVNRLFCENTPDGGFATLFFAEYEEKTRRLRYANCGHLCALLLRSDGEVDRLDATATVLGLFREWDCQTGERTLRAGDIVALYTDGITEAFNDADEEFGEERLVAALQQNRVLPCADLLNAVVGDVRRHSPHEQRDDITMIVARCK
jgi:hypothetical protein